MAAASCAKHPPRLKPYGYPCDALLPSTQEVPAKPRLPPRTLQPPLRFGVNYREIGKTLHLL